MTGIDAIAELFAGPGAREYLGEAVTIRVSSPGLAPMPGTAQAEPGGWASGSARR